MGPEETNPPEENKLKQIRTFEGDVADAIKNQNESIISIQRAGEKRRSENKTEEPEEASNKGLLLALGIVALLVLGGGIAYFTYNTYIEKTALPEVEIPSNQFVSPESVSEIDASTLSKQAMFGVVAIEKSKERGESAITHIQLRRGSSTAGLLTPEDFMLRINSRAPQPLVRAFGEEIMLGLLGVNPAHTFIVISIDSFANAFSGMLDWERNLAEDILPMFAEDEVVENLPTNSVWSDLIIQNRDTRILKDPSGKTVLVYGFFENRLLIISDNESTWRTLADRLEAQKLSR